MKNPSKTRFFLPGIFMLAGIAFSVYTFWQFTSGLPTAFDYLEMYSIIEGTAWTDIAIILLIAIPILALEYFLLGIPIASLFLFIHKTVKAAAYDTNIMQIGKEFGGLRILKRAAAPALFSVSLAGLSRVYLEQFFSEPPGTVSSELLFLWPITITLMASLIIMPIALALYIPTWILNDAGLVSHLEADERKVRQTPDMRGVGRWYSDMLGGYSLISFPISMFIAHFYVPYLEEGAVQEINAYNILSSFLWTLGIPLLVMAFIMPVVILNEVQQDRVISRIHGVAKKMRALEVESAKVKKA
jgi:hypothetical protein